MKQFFKRLPWYIIGIILSAIIEVLDGIVVGAILCVKTIRLLTIWILSSRRSAPDTDRNFIECLSITNPMVNKNYKTIIDTLYPID